MSTKPHGFPADAEREYVVAISRDFKRYAEAATALSEKYREQLTMVGRAFEQAGGNVETFTAAVEAVARASCAWSEFVCTVRRQYEAQVEQAMKAAPLDRDEFAKQFLLALGVPEHGWTHSMPLGGQVVAPHSGSIDSTDKLTAAGGSRDA